MRGVIHRDVNGSRCYERMDTRAASREICQTDGESRHADLG